VDTVVKWAARQCGLNPAAFGGHSLRAGYATYLAQLNRPPTLIARQGRWKSLDMVLTYARDDVAKGLVGSY
jgi:integrase